MTAMTHLPNNGIIKTERMQLLPAAVKYAEHIFTMSENPSVSKFLAWDPPNHLDETVTMLRSLESAMMRGDSYHWIAVVNDQAVGVVSLIDVKRQHRSWRMDRAELAYWIGAEHQGKGYATEAGKAVIKYAFEYLSFHKLRAYHAADNYASANTIRKLGYRLVGVEHDAFYKQGKWHTLWHYELLVT